MRTRKSRLVSLGLLFTAFAGCCQAQELAGSFEQLRVLVKPGDRVSVVDTRGQEVRGPISELSSSALALNVSGTPIRFLEGQIDAIRQRRPDPLANGAKWGLAVGAGLGVLAGIGLASEYEEGGGTLIPVLAFAYGAIGAGAGAGIDALISSEQVIFARHGSRAAVTVRPRLRRGGPAVLATFGF